MRRPPPTSNVRANEPLLPVEVPTAGGVATTTVPTTTPITVTTTAPHRARRKAARRPPRTLRCRRGVNPGSPPAVPAMTVRSRFRLVGSGALAETCLVGAVRPVGAAHVRVGVREDALRALPTGDDPCVHHPPGDGH